MGALPDIHPKARAIVFTLVAGPCFSWSPAKRPRADWSCWPVVVLTTSNDERDKVEAYHLNVAGYLLQPVSFTAFSELLSALDKYWKRVELP